MNANKRNSGEPIENLAIGTIIEVDGSRIIAELNPSLTELSARLRRGNLFHWAIRFYPTNTLRPAANLCVCE